MNIDFWAGYIIGVLVGGFVLHGFAKVANSTYESIRRVMCENTEDTTNDSL